ncbi:hypothetical protein GCM10007888_54480 [Methylobacterium oxalidis]|uniref:Uncharacterized protein n=1 Tax=Methylobacterium oxalidis TaxID=944322 RepID=A0ABQ6DSB9_9HYPH|nr:hypothetical protein GCM10007888_54480 [Methylobacterium oxalidis]
MHCANMAKLLPLGLSRASVIVAGLLTPTSLMSWTHIVELVHASEFESSNMLDDPALPHAVDAVAAHDAFSIRTLPGLEPAAGGEMSAPRRTDILRGDEGHRGARP